MVTISGSISRFATWNLILSIPLELQISYVDSDLEKKVLFLSEWDAATAFLLKKGSMQL